MAEEAEGVDDVKETEPNDEAADAKSEDTEQEPSDKAPSLRGRGVPRGRGAGRGRGTRGRGKSSPSPSTSATASSSAGGKKLRKWGDDVSADELASLNRSKSSEKMEAVSGGGERRERERVRKERERERERVDANGQLGGRGGADGVRFRGLEREGGC